MLDREEKEELEANKNKKSDCGEVVSKPRVSKVQRMLDMYKSPIQKQKEKEDKEAEEKKNKEKKAK